MKVRIEEDEILIDLTGKALGTFDKKLVPKILKKNFTLKINDAIPKKTVTLAGKSLNPHYYSCSCRDYRMSAEKYPRRDFRRICKHLIAYILKYYFDDIDILTRTILEHKLWYKISNVIEVELDQKIFYVGYTKDFEIFNIYLPSDLPVYYSYNCTIKKWKNLDEPFQEIDLNISLTKFIQRLNIISKRENRQK